MNKRLFDIVVSAVGLLILSPILSVVLLLVWLQDQQSPFYFGERVGRDKKTFKMLKIRSMIINAEKTGVESTSADDARITPLGRIIRQYKLDEFLQLVNVLKGDMSIVGPRPNTLREVQKYTNYEMRLLDMRPGITDISSIVFSDEGDILKGVKDPDAVYERVIRPWKAQLGVLYVNNASILLDLQIIWLTIMVILKRQKALNAIGKLVARLGASEQIQKVASRQIELI